jgi:hypothetical protein
MDGVSGRLLRRHGGSDAGSEGDVVAVVDQGVLALAELLRGIEVQVVLVDVEGRAAPVRRGAVGRHAVAAGTAVYGSHGGCVEVGGEGQVFDGQGLHGGSPKVDAGSVWVVSVVLHSTDIQQGACQCL